MYPPLDLSREKRGMVWVEIKVLQENMMNNTKCWRELEWVSDWGRIDGIHHYKYCKITSDQHHLFSNIPDNYSFQFNTHENFISKQIIFLFSARHHCRARECGSLCSAIVVPFHSLPFRPTFVAVSFNIRHSFVQCLSTSICSSGPFRPSMSVRRHSSPSTHHIFQIVCTTYICIQYCILKNGMYCIHTYPILYSSNRMYYIHTYPILSSSNRMYCIHTYPILYSSNHMLC